jgi:hypothetical protein
MAVLTPTTRAFASNSGPPELPGLMAASVSDRADEALGHRVSKPQRRSDRDGRVADDNLVRVRYGDRPDSALDLSARVVLGVGVDLDHRQVVVRVPSEQLRGRRRLVLKGDSELVCLLHDVVVRDDPALGIDDEARADALRCFGQAGTGSDNRDAGDVDDRVARLTVDT